jgi:hypothetical protein
MGKLDELCSENKKMKGELGSLTSMVVELKTENSQQKTEKLLLQRRLSQFEEEDQDQLPTPVPADEYFPHNHRQNLPSKEAVNGQSLAQQLENKSILEKLVCLEKANTSLEQGLRDSEHKLAQELALKLAEIERLTSDLSNLRASSHTGALN